jgi:hypothetical protein
MLMKTIDELVSSKKQESQARGISVLGKTDPRTLSREEFNRSEDLLFHGSSELFDFSQGFDYGSQEYLQENDGSTTLGFGFYAIDDRVEAENYSIVRQANSSGSPSVIDIMPYQARVLDLRDKSDVTKNVAIPRDLTEKWQAAFLDYLRVKEPRSGNLGTILDSMETEYASYLSRVMDLDEIDLRILLETAPSPKVKSRNLPSPSWTRLFTNFMMNQGFDGLVYNEGGEGRNGKGGSTYVFYNLKKIGTYETWNKTLAQ